MQSKSWSMNKSYMTVIKWAEIVLKQQIDKLKDVCLENNILYS